MNEQNLIPFSERSENEARENGRKGGIASGEARRRKRQLKEDFLALLDTIGDGDKTNQENIAAAIVAKALNGDIRAAEFIRDTIGEKPDQKMNITAAAGLSEADRALLKEAIKINVCQG